MLSNTCKYAIRALVYISLYQNDRLLNIREIAKGLEVPEPFLAKILQVLAKQKILYSQRGINGGFKFQVDPHKISFLKIVDLFDGLSIFNTCILGIRICEATPEYAENCPFRKKLDPVRDSLYKVLKNNTIGEFTDNLSDYKDFILI